MPCRDRLLERGMMLSIDSSVTAINVLQTLYEIAGVKNVPGARGSAEERDD